MRTARLLALALPLALLGSPPARAQGLLPAPVQGNVPIPGLVKEEPPTDAEKTLDAAIEGLKKMASFSATIAQSVDMLNQKFDVKGLYLRAKGDRVYLKLAVSGLGDTPATTLQVCDGTTLWDYQQVLENQTYRKLTITGIMKKLADPVLDAPVREQVLSRLGFAGPESMLAGLRKSVRFDQKADDTLDGKKVWVIRGAWKDRAGLTAPGQTPIPATAPLPPYIPSNVTIYLGQDDGWPYRIDLVGNLPSMLQQDTRRIGPDGRPMGAKVPAPKVNPSRVVLRYTDVKINPEIPPAAFAFSAPPDNKNVFDGTDEFLTLLDRKIQEETLRKKAESSKNEGLLPGIDVPKSSLPAPGGASPSSPLPAPATLVPAPAPGPDAPAAPK